MINRLAIIIKISPESKKLRACDGPNGTALCPQKSDDDEVLAFDIMLPTY
jgi:hypothetical protein